MDKTSFKCVRPVVIPILATLLIGLLAGCSSVPLNEQKALIQKRQYTFHVLTMRAFLELWGQPTYVHQENTQFYPVKTGSTSHAFARLSEKRLQGGMRPLSRNPPCFWGMPSAENCSVSSKIAWSIGSR